MACTQAQRDRLLDRWSVVIARWNARAIRCAVPREHVVHSDDPGLGGSSALGAL